MPKDFNLVPKKSIYCKKKFNLLPKKIKISAKINQNYADKIQNSAKKIQKKPNLIDWVLSKRACDVITVHIYSFD